MRGPRQYLRAAWSQYDTETLDVEIGGARTL